MDFVIFIILLEVFKLSTGLAREELHLCYILLEKKPRICRQKLLFWRVWVLCIQMREKMSQCLLSHLCPGQLPSTSQTTAPIWPGTHCHQLDEWSLHLVASRCSCADHQAASAWWLMARLWDMKQSHSSSGPSSCLILITWSDIAIMGKLNYRPTTPWI